MPRAFIHCCLISLLATASAAAPFPTSPETQVNEFTTGKQLNSVAATLPDGSTIVAFEGQDDGDRSIFGRFVNASGQAIGAEFQVNVDTSDDRTSADVAALPSGEFIVVWENEAYNMSISSRRYDSAGTPSAPLAIALPEVDIDAYDPLIAVSEDNRFVVVWESYDSDIEQSSFRTRFLSASGAMDGGIFSIESSAPDEVIGSLALSERANDGFLASWRSRTATDELRVRAYSVDGSPDGALVPVTTGESLDPTMTGLDDDGFLVIWGTGVDGLERQRFRGDGSSGVPTDLTDSAQTQRDPVAIALPNERAAIAWWQSGDSQPTRILVQIVAADDSVEAQFQVDESAATASQPALAYDAARAELIVTWNRRGTPGSDQEEVYLRRYALEGVFGDGFETGDTSTWSSEE